MPSFIEQISQGMAYDKNQVVGYSEVEIGKISRLYDVNVSGQLRQFLFEMGRSDGGLIGDDPIILYRPKMSVRRHVLLQLRLEVDFKEFRIEAGLNLLKERPFLVSIESETQYFFVATKSDKPDRVYQYDENNESVRDTGIDLLEYMKNIVQVWGGRSAIVCRGELIVI